MAYSSVTKPEDHFNTVTFTGNGSTQSITGVGFQPDWVWIKNRGATTNHELADSVRGANKLLKTNATDAEQDNSNKITSFDSDGFGVGNDANVNQNSTAIVSWNWLAGGTAPAITYVVKVVSDSGNKYRFDDFGTSAVTLDLQEGGTYTFDQSDSSNSGHPLRFYTASDKTGGEYTTGVTTTGTPGSSGAQTVITVAASAPTLYYQCSNHAGMGGQANTNSTFGSSNFSGGIQSTVSANTTAGFSVVKYTGTGSATTVGHGLGVAPKMIIVKRLNNADGWQVYVDGLSSVNHYLRLDTNAAQASDSSRFGGAPTTSVFSVGTANGTNASGDTYVAYCFAEKKGYSKFGFYTGNSSTDGPFIYTGFKPAFFLVKRTDSSENWYMKDNKRDPFNDMNQSVLYANGSAAEDTGGAWLTGDACANGFKIRKNDTSSNGSGSTYFHMAFAENPFVANDSGTVVPSTAR